MRRGERYTAPQVGFGPRQEDLVVPQSVERGEGGIHCQTEAALGHPDPEDHRGRVTSGALPRNGADGGRSPPQTSIEGRKSSLQVLLSSLREMMGKALPGICGSR